LYFFRECVVSCCVLLCCGVWGVVCHVVSCCVVGCGVLCALCVVVCVVGCCVRCVLWGVIVCLLFHPVGSHVVFSWFGYRPQRATATLSPWKPERHAECRTHRCPRSCWAPISQILRIPLERACGSPTLILVVFSRRFQIQQI